MDLPSLALAKSEAEYLDAASIVAVDGYALGKNGVKYWKGCTVVTAAEAHKLFDAMAEHHAPVWYAEAMGYDGVWWEEELDPFGLSAPRGGLFRPEEWEIELEHVR